MEEREALASLAMDKFAGRAAADAEALAVANPEASALALSAAMAVRSAVFETLVALVTTAPGKFSNDQLSIPAADAADVQSTTKAFAVALANVDLHSVFGVAWDLALDVTKCVANVMLEFLHPADEKESAREDAASAVRSGVNSTVHAAFVYIVVYTYLAPSRSRIQELHDCYHNLARYHVAAFAMALADADVDRALAFASHIAFDVAKNVQEIIDVIKDEFLNPAASAQEGDKTEEGHESEEEHESETGHMSEEHCLTEDQFLNMAAKAATKAVASAKWRCQGEFLIPPAAYSASAGLEDADDAADARTSKEKQHSPQEHFAETFDEATAEDHAKGEFVIPADDAKDVLDDAELEPSAYAVDEGEFLIPAAVETPLGSPILADLSDWAVFDAEVRAEYAAMDLKAAADRSPVLDLKDCPADWAVFPKMVLAGKAAAHPSPSTDAVAEGEFLIPAADAIEEHVAMVEEAPRHEVAAPWHKGEFTEVMRAYMEIDTNSRASWLTSQERALCLSRMPLCELRRRRLAPPAAEAARPSPSTDAVAEGEFLIPGADAIEEHVAMMVEEVPRHEEAEPWHRSEYTKVMAAYMTIHDSRASWLASEERKRCISRMPFAELVWRRFDRRGGEVGEVGGDQGRSTGRVGAGEAGGDHGSP